MRPSVQANLIFATQTQANTVRGRLVTSIGRMRTPPFQEEPPTVVSYHGNWLVNASLYCITEADADLFYGDATNTWLVAEDRDQVLAGSFVRRFNNHDDEGPNAPPDEHLYSIRKDAAPVP